MLKLNFVRLTIAFSVMFFSVNVYSLERGETRTVSGQNAAELLSAFDDTAWVPTGETAETHVYVLYSPACPISKRMREATRSLEDEVQFRWVPHKYGGAKAVASHRNENALDEAFNRNPPAVEDEAKASGRLNWNKAVASNNIDLIGTNGGRSFSWPTMIYPTEEGAAVTVGPGDYRKVAERVTARVEGVNHRAAALDVEAPMNLVRVSQDVVYSEDGNPLIFRAVPDEEAPVVTTLDPKYQLDVVGGNGDGWLAAEVLTDGTLGWVRQN